MEGMETATRPLAVADAKAEFDRAIDRIKSALVTTPDDKLNWSPHASARTPLMQVAHSAAAIDGMTRWFQGEHMDFSDIAAVDARWREEEREVKTREDAVQKLEASRSTYHAYLDSLSQEQVDSMMETPMGPREMSDVITWPADHTRGHTAQLEYTQTCYGDLDWHVG